MRSKDSTFLIILGAFTLGLGVMWLNERQKRIDYEKTLTYAGIGTKVSNIWQNIDDLIKIITGKK